MKYTDAQFEKALEELDEMLGSISNSDQVEWKGKLDEAIDTLRDEVDKRLQEMGRR